MIRITKKRSSKAGGGGAAKLKALAEVCLGIDQARTCMVTPGKNRNS
jgi:hypothetical protein